MKLRLFVLLSVLTVMLAPAAQAIVYREFVYTDWVTIEGMPTLLVDLEWGQGYPVHQNKTPGADCLRLYGPKPAGDPDVDQTITNLSPFTWTDWHVSILNGTITSATAGVIGGDAWDIIMEAGGTGFDAVIKPGSGAAGEVAPGEDLHVWFRFDATNPDLVVDEYPTSAYIPEPASLLGLAVGLSAMCAAVRRRVR